MRQAPAQPVKLRVGSGTVDITSMVRALPVNTESTIRVRLRCFADRGADMTKIDVPFQISTDGDLSISVSDVRLVPVADQECP